ncbi:MAG: LysR family transcriptional regulator [Planctomycetota bacterium]|nr:LysR family transcriptional regulator [Planctomycetota bacterium]
MTNLPIDVLRTFVTIVDNGGFTQAARVLRLTQPTISLQLKKLEQLVGAPVIDRTSRKQSLTAEGSALLEYARRILMLNDEAITYLFKPEVSGRLKIGIPHEFTMSILPQLVGSFSQAHPNIVIEVECELSKQLLSNSPEYDLVIALQDLGRTEGVLLRRESLAWFASLDFLVNDKGPLDIVAAPVPCIYRAHLQNALQKSGTQWNLRLTSSSYDAACAAVQTGLGVTVLAESVVQEGLKKLPLSRVLQELPDVELRLHYDSTNASAAVHRFVDFARQRLTFETNEK